MEAIIKIDEKKTFQALVQFLKSLNIQVITKQDGALKRKNKITNRRESSIEKCDPNVDPNLLFGKWKDLDIDTKKLRKESWRRI